MVYKTPKQLKLTVLGCKIICIKAKDTPWDAVLMGSVVCTVGAKVHYFVVIFQIFQLFLMINYKNCVFITAKLTKYKLLGLRNL